MYLNISQQKGNFLIQSSMSRGKHSLDLDGGASWDEHLEHGNRSLRCLKQTTKLLQGEGLELGIQAAPD